MFCLCEPYQYLKIIEPGWFYKTSDISVWLLYAALALFCLALFVVSLLNKKEEYGCRKLIRKPVNGAACVFFALTLIVNAVTRSVTRRLCILTTKTR